MYANGEIVKRNWAVGIEDIRELVLHLVANAPPPNWLRVDNAHLIERVVTLLVPGLTVDLLGLPPLPTSATANPNLPLPIPLPPSFIPFIASTFSHACPTRAPGDQTRMHSVLSAFFHGPVSVEERRKRAVQRQLSESIMNKDPVQYMLTLEQMIDNDYPIPSYMADVFERPPEWVETPAPSKTIVPPSHDTSQRLGIPPRKIYAIDCEMCETEGGKELARVCIIDYYTQNVVYDQMVKPSKPVVDYLTRWSGITAESLEHVTTTLAEVQADVLNLLSPPPPNPNPFAPRPQPSAPYLTPVLLGHSLESDLKALKMSHPYCIDTALMYHHPRGRPLKPGLAWLTRKWCGREIQNRGEGGHDPQEDALACIELLKKKLEMGPGFGEFKADHESIFERMARSTRRGRSGATAGGSIRAAVVDYGNPQMMHGSKATTTIGCTSDEEVLKGLLEAVQSHHFAFGRFMALADVLGWTTPKPTLDAPPPELAPPPSREKLAETLTILNGQLRTLHASLPPRTALIVMTGHSDPRRMALLNVKKSAFENAIRSGRPPEGTTMGADAGLGWEGKWTGADMRELEEAVALTKRGLLFLGVKA
ncbi:hypothetical protein AMATHDRAFT_152547 [Amanita thiersii Skay4041]|uniref:Exonuclease domain-containing protein n=1 Tax=Amanita thiersii Skay4041 TaxID=703135 RepID=A0A2A9NB20_9AGAR|nr:hypothetical protein AMATHDRAFT_152547 [Amanita thiersii Skay4041]